MKSELSKSPNMPHNVIIENKEKISITGVYDVRSFDENEVILVTSGGSMSVCGEDLRVEKLSVESGEIVIEGCILCIEYNEKDIRHESFWSKIF